MLPTTVKAENKMIGVAIPHEKLAIDTDQHVHGSETENIVEHFKIDKFINIGTTFLSCKMFESRTQVGAQIMIPISIANPDVQSELSMRRDVLMCCVPDRLQLPEAGGALGRATFEHLKITGELHGY